MWKCSSEATHVSCLKIFLKIIVPFCCESRDLVGIALPFGEWTQCFNYGTLTWFQPCNHTNKMVSKYQVVYNDKFWSIRNLKMYNLAKHTYNNYTMGGLIGMATLNGLLTNNNRDTKDYTKFCWSLLKEDRFLSQSNRKYYCWIKNWMLPDKLINCWYDVRGALYILLNAKHRMQNEFY